MLFGQVMKSLALLKKVCHWGWALRAYNLTPLPINTLCFLPLLPHPAFHAMMDSSPLDPETKISISSLSCSCYGISSQQQKVTNTVINDRKKSSVYWSDKRPGEQRIADVINNVMETWINLKSSEWTKIYPCGQEYGQCGKNRKTRGYQRDTVT